MREIKFRAWNGKEMLTTSELTFVHCGSYDSILCEILDGNDDKHSLMQFTGLTDKNGVDIYERCEIDNRFYVDCIGCDYVLVDISNGDMIRLSDYFKGSNGNVEITRDYREV